MSSGADKRGNCIAQRLGQMTASVSAKTPSATCTTVAVLARISTPYVVVANHAHFGATRAHSETAMSMLIRLWASAVKRTRAGNIVTMNLRMLLIIALFLSAAIPAAADERVASVLGEDIMRGQIMQEDRGLAQQFAALIWPRIARHYVDNHGLNATAAE